MPPSLLKPHREGEARPPQVPGCCRSLARPLGPPPGPVISLPEHRVPGSCSISCPTGSPSGETRALAPSLRLFPQTSCPLPPSMLPALAPALIRMQRTQPDCRGPSGARCGHLQGEGDVGRGPGPGVGSPGLEHSLPVLGLQAAVHALCACVARAVLEPQRGRPVCWGQSQDTREEQDLNSGWAGPLVPMPLVSGCLVWLPGPLLSLSTQAFS